MLSKIQLRKHFNAIRNKIPASYREEAAERASKIFIDLPSVKDSQHIACYLAYKAEFDCTSLIEAIWAAKKKCYLPVLAQDEKSLYFVHYRYGDALHLNRFSILEPIDTKHKIAPQELDITITPLVAFDKDGHRLGTGGGYYDRTFAFLKNTQEKKPIMIGLAYHQQEALLLPSDPWDIALTGVITENEYVPAKHTS